MLELCSEAGWLLLHRAARTVKRLQKLMAEHKRVLKNKELSREKAAQELELRTQELEIAKRRKVVYEGHFGTGPNAGRWLEQLLQQALSECTMDDRNLVIQCQAVLEQNPTDARTVSRAMETLPEVLHAPFAAIICARGPRGW